MGSGPRGLIVLERLAARLSEDGGDREVEIHLIDAVEVGAGRVYRTDQPEWFLMNTVAGMVSAFSGVPDDGPARAGSGPSLYEWWRTIDPVNASPDGYASRADYGRYTRFLLDAVEAGLPECVRLVRVHARVDDLDRDGDTVRLTLSRGDVLVADRVVLTTGHSTTEPVGWQRDLADFAAERPALRFIQSDSPADMPLDAITAGTPVGVVGLGLSFYDAMAALTLGRGGRFIAADDDGTRLRYLPSGDEPVLVAGSRSGMPLPARGRNQKPPRFSYQPRLFTMEHIRSRCPSGPLDFRADLLPWLLAEVNLVYYATLLRRRAGTAAEDDFVSAVVGAADDAVLPDLPAIAASHGLAGVAGIDLDELARPFADRTFAGRAEFEAELRALITADIAEADLGNVESPLKAALDVLRDCRGLIIKLVDFSGLNPISHQRDFLGWYAPRSAFLAAGPPAIRLRQVLALMDAGVLRIIGPLARFAADHNRGRFTVSSLVVADALAEADVVIDARVPDPDLERDRSPLTKRLRDKGIWTTYANRGDTATFPTGGVAITASPYHPIDRDGRPDERLYVVGIPTEHTRWFMQVGSNRPGLWGDFVHDADAIAAHLLKGDD